MATKPELIADRIQDLVFRLSDLRNDVDEIHRRYVEELFKWQNEGDENIAGDDPIDIDADTAKDHICDAITSLEDALEIARKWRKQ